MNTRLYKVQFPTTDPTYELGETTGENLFQGFTGSLKYLAGLYKRRMRTGASIDFTPFHDVHISCGLIPYRCFALTPKEQDEFWLHFTKAE